MTIEIYHFAKHLYKLKFINFNTFWRKITYYIVFWQEEYVYDYAYADSDSGHGGAEENEIPEEAPKPKPEKPSPSPRSEYQDYDEEEYSEYETNLENEYVYNEIDEAEPTASVHDGFVAEDSDNGGSGDGFVCPGGDLQTCVDVCPGQFGAKVYGACVLSCGRRCPWLLSSICVPTTPDSHECPWLSSICVPPSPE